MSDEVRRPDWYWYPNYWFRNRDKWLGLFKTLRRVGRWWRTIIINHKTIKTTIALQEAITCNAIFFAFQYYGSNTKSNDIVVFLTIYFARRAFSWIIQVGRWPPCPVLPTLEMGNKYVRLSTESVYLGWVLEDGARRPPSYWEGASVYIKRHRLWWWIRGQGTTISTVACCDGCIFKILLYRSDAWA